MSKERSREETLLIARNMIGLLENWDPDDSEEESAAKMLPVLRQIRLEAEEREANKDALSSASTFSHSILRCTNAGYSVRRSPGTRL